MYEISIVMNILITLLIAYFSFLVARDIARVCKGVRKVYFVLGLVTLITLAILVYLFTGYFVMAWLQLALYTQNVLMGVALLICLFALCVLGTSTGWSLAAIYAVIEVASIVFLSHLVFFGTPFWSITINMFLVTFGPQFIFFICKKIN